MKQAKEIQIANLGEETPILQDQLANNQPGVIYAANASRFVEAFFQEKLTGYAVGWKDEDKLDELLEFISPMVSVPRRFEYAEMKPEDSFTSETDDIRAIGSDFKRVEFKSVKTVEKTDNIGLTYRVDLDNLDEDANPNWREKATGWLMNRLTRNQLRRAALALHNASTNNAKTWTSGTPDPDLDVLTLVDTFGDTVGINANRVLFGFTGWVNRWKGYKLAVASERGLMPRTPAELATALGVDEVRISKERYRTSATANAKLVTAANVYIFAGKTGMSVDDHSSLKNFVTSAGGQRYRVYEQQVTAKLFDITVEHYAKVKATTSAGVQRITSS